MPKTAEKKDRLSLDVSRDEHRKIKAFAALRGQSIREFVLESVRARLRRKQEDGELLAMSTRISEPLKELWANEKDAVYDDEA